MKERFRNTENGRQITGIFLLIFGGLIFMKTMGISMPWWLFSWPMFIIGLGLYIGVKHKFQNQVWIILVLVGSVFLWDNMVDGINLKKYIFPLILIGVGLSFLLRPKNKSNNWLSDWKHNGDDEQQTGGFSSEDHVESVSIFGGDVKKILSKNFKGADIVNIMGGTDLNLLQADFQQKIRIEVVNIMGGTVLKIPADWEVQSEMVSIFGGTDDSRVVNSNQMSENKVIILSGVNIFGGIEIKSY